MKFQSRTPLLESRIRFKINSALRKNLNTEEQKFIHILDEVSNESKKKKKILSTLSKNSLLGHIQKKNITRIKKLSKKT